MNINSTERNWLKNPKGKEAAITFIAWFIGVTLVLFAGTDFFRESFFMKKNLAVGFLALLSTIFMLIIFINFIKKKK